MRRDAGIHVWETSAARNTPRDSSNQNASTYEWTTGVSHAGTMSLTEESANGVIEDAGSVGDAVTGTAVSQSQSIGDNELQMAGNAGVCLYFKENLILLLFL